MVFGEYGVESKFIYNIESDIKYKFPDPIAPFDIIKWDLKTDEVIGIDKDGYFVANHSFSEKTELINFEREFGGIKKLIYPPLISPNNQLIAYFVGGGSVNAGMTISEFDSQNLFVKRIGESTSFMISVNGGARFLSSTRYKDLLNIWSPDNSLLIFSDYDNVGVLQLFIASYDGLFKYQITSRHQNRDLIDFNYMSSWSPSGQYLAVSYYENQSEIKIVNLHQLDDQSIISNANVLWWVNDEKLLIYSSDLSGIAEYDIRTKNIKKLISSGDDWLYLPAPYLVNEKIGYFLYDKEDLMKAPFYVFDIKLKTTTLVENVHLPSPTTSFWYCLPTSEILP